MIEIKGGADFAVAYSNLNRIFAWGSGEFGQLTLLEVGNFTVPTDITSTFGMNPEESISLLALGAQHAWVYTSTGRLLGWGNNSDDQLSDALDTTVLMPSDVAMFFMLGVGETIVSVDAGYNSSMFITSLGRIFAVGADTNGVFGDGVVSNLPLITDITPTITLLGGEIAEEIIISRTYSSFIMTDAGSIYVSGGNINGQLGVGSNSDLPISIPVLVVDWLLYGIQSYDYQDTLSLLTDPTNGTDIFDGWFTEPELINPFVLTEMPAGDIVIYGGWTEMPV